MRCASSSFAVTVDMNGGVGFCQVVFASTGPKRSAAAGHERAVERAAHPQLHGLAGTAGGRLLDQAVDRRVLARDHDLAGAVVVRRPHAVDRDAQLLDDRIVEPEHRRHRAGVLPRRLGHRLAALADERDRVAGAIASAAASAEYSPTEWPIT